MMSYAKKHVGHFVNKAWVYPMLVGIFKVAGGVFCSITNALVIMQSPDETEAVKDFIAVGIISQIDNIMAGTLNSFDCPTLKIIEDEDRQQIYVKSEIDKLQDWEIWQKFSPVIGEHQKESPDRLNWFSFTLLVLSMFIYRGFALFYHILYFYFMPLLVCIIYYLTIRSKVKKLNKELDDADNKTKAAALAKQKVTHN